jgi:rSAM/selenodomain-associated transferase 1
VTGGVGPVALVVAKAPTPGQVKTRLAVAVGDDSAARLAAASLLDTIDVCEQVFGPGRRFLCLDGDLMTALDGERIQRRLTVWTVFRQQGTGLGERLAHAHREVHERACQPVVQIGMDTPQLVPGTLEGVVRTLTRGADPVVGLAYDGGWWLLASTDAAQVEALAAVPMSTGHTGAATVAMLASAGHRVELAPMMRDVDDPDDAEHVARAAPWTRFARAWRGVTDEGRIRW